MKYFTKLHPCTTDRTDSLAADIKAEYEEINLDLDGLNEEYDYQLNLYNTLVGIDRITARFRMTVIKKLITEKVMEG